MLKNIEIWRYFKIPIMTLRSWNKYDKDNWRYRLLLFLKTQDKEKVEIFLNVFNLDFEKDKEKK